MPPRAISRIQAAVAAYYGLRVQDLTGRRRTRHLARPRQVAMYLARRHTNYSYPAIGRCFGGRDHTTVLDACRVVERQARTDPEIARDLARLEVALRSESGGALAAGLAELGREAALLAGQVAGLEARIAGLMAAEAGDG